MIASYFGPCWIDELHDFTGGIFMYFMRQSLLWSAKARTDIILYDAISAIKALDGDTSSTNFTALSHPSTNSMTLVSNDPSWWPSINAFRISSYFLVATFAGVIYDWALTFGQEVELIWRQRWSLMTFLYLSVRYVGIIYAALSVLDSVPTIPVTDAGCVIMSVAQNAISVVVNVMLGVIIIARLHAMYQRSRKVLILLVVVFLAVNITDGVVTVIVMRHISADVLILSGTYQCIIDFQGGSLILDTITWIIGAVWEVLALCLAVWIAIKHFRELPRNLTGGIIGDCFTVLMKTHVVYFVGFVALSGFSLAYAFSTMSADIYSLGTQIYLGVLQIFTVVQLFVLGPRLILSVREYNAKLVADSDTGTAMTSIAFQERVHVSTSSSV